MTHITARYRSRKQSLRRREGASSIAYRKGPSTKYSTDTQDLTSSDLPTASAEGLTKKKKSKKTATDFAKELDDLDAERQDQVADELDREIGEDPFEGGEGDADDGDDDGEDVDAWVKEGRVATYPEVRFLPYSFPATL